MRGVKIRKIFEETDMEKKRGGKYGRGEEVRERRKQLLPVFKYRYSFSCISSMTIIKVVTIALVGYIVL